MLTFGKKALNGYRFEENVFFMKHIQHNIYFWWLHIYLLKVVDFVNMCICYVENKFVYYKIYNWWAFVHKTKCSAFLKLPLPLEKCDRWYLSMLLLVVLNMSLRMKPHH